MKKTDLYQSVLNRLSSQWPNAQTELNYRNPYELLVAVILSAQCTDKRVNLITPKLFDTYPTPEALSNASIEQIYELIKSVSYPNNKAQHLSDMAKKLVQDFNSTIPNSRTDLMTLPGVGRKTANVIQAVLYNEACIAVDTHVERVSKRIGLVPQKASTLATELELEKNIPPDIRPQAHHWLILHGRYTCIARKPKCTDCTLTDICKYSRKTLA